MNTKTQNAGRILGLALAASAMLTIPTIAQTSGAPSPDAAVTLPDAKNVKDPQLQAWAQTLSPHQREITGMTCVKKIGEDRAELDRLAHHHNRRPHGPDRYKILLDEIQNLERIIAALNAQPAAPTYVSIQSQMGLKVIPFDPRKPIGVPMGEPTTPFTQADDDFIKKGGCHLTWDSVVNADCPVYKIEKDTTIVGVMGIQADGSPVFLQTQQTIINVQQSGWMDHGQGWGGLALQGLGLITSTTLGAEAISIARQGLHAQQNLDVSISDGIKGGKITSIFGSFGGCGNMTIIGNTSSSGTGTKVNGGASAVCNFDSTLTNVAEGLGDTSSPTNPVTTITAAYGALGL